MSSPEKYRMLCMDGGGIYGYFTVLMLKNLAQRYDCFLSPHHVTAFAGTSAGALISMLLAKEENPREYLLSGKLEAFFKSELLHGNTVNPMDAWLSLFGLSTWCGGDDMRRLLHQEFGDRTLADLPNKVLIMTFDISGRTTHAKDPMKRRWKTKVFHNFPVIGNDLESPAWLVAYGAACPATIRPVIDGITDGGIYAMSPTLGAIAQFISIAKRKNVLLNELRQLMPRDYLQGTLDLLTRLLDPTQRTQADITAYEHYLFSLKMLLEKLRFEYNMITDENFFRYAMQTLNHGIDWSTEEMPAQMGHVLNIEIYLLGLLDKVLHETKPSTGNETPQELIQKLMQTLNNLKDQSVLEEVSSLQVLSLGVGNFIPHYFQDNFNLGFGNFNMLPTNPLQNAWEPPAAHLLYSPSTDHTDYEAKQLLDDNYYRCNPTVIGYPTPPVVMSLYLARFRFFREQILKNIEKAFENAGDEMDQCSNWMIRRGWVC